MTNPRDSRDGDMAIIAFSTSHAGSEAPFLTQLVVDRRRDVRFRHGLIIPKPFRAESDSTVANGPRVPFGRNVRSPAKPPPRQKDQRNFETGKNFLELSPVLPYGPLLRL
ncbi:hypothetical protein CSOJ01_01743 [Colletotrichum sojae]|uniref:Uncharacterized protein n=1 Tax=Colletotrichum sojae TaxID=2175907 RepID=A0A8H6JT81_9PEZI|nr:hypothetical protein CSOJ01_01743 [Colletotrichum sojae]